MADETTAGWMPTWLAWTILVIAIAVGVAVVTLLQR